MGISEGGQDLDYGIQIALASQPTNFVTFPTAPVSIAWTDRSMRAEHENMAGDAKVSYQKIVAPTVSVGLDGLSMTDRMKWRSIAITTGEFYIVRLFRLERILAVASVAYNDGGTIKCVLPHSSYSLASKKAVAAGGSSLLSSFVAHTTWGSAIADLPNSLITVPSYADATETLSLGGAGVPAAGDVVFINATASGWLAKLAAGPQISPITGAASIQAGSVTFEGA